jgi:ATP synthase protein I
MLVIQVILTLILAGGVMAFSGAAALSILIGGGTSVLATALFAASVFGPYEARRPEALLGRIIGAEIGKLILVIGLFVFAFARVDGLNVPAMLAAYFAAQMLPAMIAPYLGAGSKP